MTGRNAPAPGPSRATPSRRRGSIRAVLGPTNTGKTFLAVERMLGHASGMIGFPLRLLARENYDRIVDRAGRASVALITGEEKIIPPNPRFLVCTVEAMPMDRDVDFLAIDEIQLCADPERGHIFTDRLLHARGRHETMFLGSDSMTEMIRLLVPDAEIEGRERLSTLSWAGEKKLSRLKRRSAVVAFSVDQVYELAEALRQTRGGTAVVLGALSPRTRNAQVEMYQAGEVDYLVATDAIGMGLNMDVDHVAFAQLRKFDGARRRMLTAPEIGQIAGRAGRHMNDGTFGVTNNTKPPDPEVLRRVEEHDYPPVKQIYWRNRALDFASPKRLYASLNEYSGRDELVRARDADDQLVLAALMREAAVEQRTGSRDRVQLLWDVCQVPDFRKTMPEHHATLVASLFTHLVDRDGRLPTDWVAGHIERLDRTDGDIDTLTARLAHIRTWTYITHRADWLDGAADWQMRTRQIEDSLSDALHQRLTDRFVDRRAAVIGRSRGAEGAEMLSAVNAKGQVIVEGHVVGHMEGLRFLPHEAADRREAKALMAAAHRALTSDAPRRVQAVEQSEDQAFGMTPEGRITWQGREIARVERGDSLLSPRCVLLSHSLSESVLAERVRLRAQSFLDGYLRRRLPALYTPAVSAADLDSPARGLLFQLREGLGAMARREARDNLKAMGDDARAALTKAGLRLGRDWIYLSGILDVKAVRARAILWAAASGRPVPEIPNTTAPSLPADRVPEQVWPLLGYAPLGPIALRLDRWEQLAAHLRNRKKGARFEPDAEFCARLGLAADDPALPGVLRALGFKQEATGDSPNAAFVPVSRNRGAKRKGHKKQQSAKPSPARPNPDSPFAVLQDLVVGKKSAQSR
ncbi:helicase-related protein [Pacificispira sp.]|uniref:helicase-related protein n=1 Tax=Pacificispira sp. TaxID=2888761 RepID=UPI003BADB734